MDSNKIWMSSAKRIGCTFAALFAKNPELVGWKTIVNPHTFFIPSGAFILSIQFPEMNKSSVTNWALNNGFYIEKIDDHNEGLRYKINENVAWVQYFGFDSHVKTRQAPIPELMLCVKLPAKYYWKVGFKGVLHLAHASINSLKAIKVDRLWETSFKNTAKTLGHKPTIVEASKTTFHNEK